MNRRTKASLFAAALAIGFGALQAKAAAILNYDLRIVSGPTAATNGGHTVTNPSAGDYTFQLWAQLNGADSNNANDSVTTTLTDIVSGQGTGTGLAFSGATISPNGTGVTSSNVNSTVFQSSTGGLVSNISNDQVDDWASNSQTVVPGWQLVQNSTAIVGGGSVGEQVAGNPDGWEFLLATGTIHVSGLNAAGSQDLQTTFTPGFPAVSGTFAYSGVGKQHPVVAVLDGTTINNNSFLSSTGITFDIPGTVPEPASLGVLALGGLALVARRRK